MVNEVSFKESDIQNLIKQNSLNDFRDRNSALIVAASFFGLTSLELSLLSLNNLMDKNGNWLSEWILPPECSWNGESRTLYIPSHINSILDNYVRWLSLKKVGMGKTLFFRGHDPDMNFFVNDNLKKFALTKRLTLLKNNKPSYQPRTMDDKLKSFIENAGIIGATPSAFRNYWINIMYSNGCGIDDLMSVSGYKSKKALTEKIRANEINVRCVFDKICLNFDFNN
jgi:hypothetical protein